MSFLDDILQSFGIGGKREWSPDDVFKTYREGLPPIPKPEIDRRDWREKLPTSKNIVTFHNTPTLLYQASTEGNILNVARGPGILKSIWFEAFEVNTGIRLSEYDGGSPALPILFNLRRNGISVIDFGLQGFVVASLVQWGIPIAIMSHETPLKLDLPFNINDRLTFTIYNGYPETIAYTGSAEGFYL